MNNFHGTTIVCVKKNSSVALGGDGQVTLGNTTVKHTSKKSKKTRKTFTNEAELKNELIKVAKK